MTTAVWSRYNGTNFFVSTAQINAAGTPGAVHTLSGAGQDATSPTLTVAPSGIATIAWVYSTNVIQATQISAAGAPSGVIHTLPGTAAFQAGVQIAGSSAGVSTVIWDDNAGVIETVQISASGVVGSIHALSPPGASRHDAQVAVNQATGVATAVWDRYDGTSFVLQTRQIASNGTPAALTYNLSTTGISHHDASSPRVALNSTTGVASIVWLEYDGSDNIVQATLFGAPGAGVQNLSLPGADASNIQVLADQTNGVTSVVWSRGSGVTWTIQTSQINASGVLDPEQDVSPAGGNSEEPQIVPNLLSGIMTIIYYKFNGSNNIVQAVTSGLSPANF